jgi:hypothetical protein
VVPVRVLVDRMINNPSDCDSLLDDAIVIAHVSKGEHKTLGGIFTHHSTLYEEMLDAEVTELPDLGHKRYRAMGIVLHPVSDEHKPPVDDANRGDRTDGPTAVQAMSANCPGYDETDRLPGVSHSDVVSLDTDRSSPIRTVASRVDRTNTGAAFYPDSR